ncbi:MAG: hypothetical protein JO091_06770 [Acidobacteriaceae bacterium]|nr:hypothetical protein [Acidobacteriaceae bacterium]
MRPLTDATHKTLLEIGGRTVFYGWRRSAGASACRDRPPELSLSGQVPPGRKEMPCNAFSVVQRHFHAILPVRACMPEMLSARLCVCSALNNPFSR